ncbi:hypothetical protein FGRMN_8855 [Fusarium graminum]|nr:hypothetical protein FGRMN_8855 [Fusarium graminum]
MDSDDYDRPRAFRVMPDTPDSPSPRTAGLARKRAASINTADANYGRLERLKLSTPSSMASNESTRDICLCAPAPKIPRPRNAFILYRQHHQAQVVARNPNISNPDISKIIGEQWKDESQEVKDNWKSLADEEKQRHQLQYPDYRYQPRRGNRGQGTRPGSSPTDDSGRCSKCNLRCIATPSTPSTPFPTPSTEGKNPPYTYTPSLQGEDAEAIRRGSFSNLPVMRQRHPLNRPAHREVDDYDLDSPEMKRRRYNTTGGYHPVSSPIPGGRAMSMGSAPQRPYPVTPLPEPHFTRSKSGPMPPPPRPVGGPWSDQENRGRHPSYDESLRLPPLQTPGPMSPTATPEVDFRQLQTPVTGLGISNARDPQARSVEAMVMSIPFIRKLSVLSKINRTHASTLEPGSSGVEQRGAVVAIEGPKPRMLKQVGSLIERALLSSNEVALKAWCKAAEDERGSERPGSRSENLSEPKDDFASCFETMIDWHQKSREMVKHITTLPEILPGSKRERDSESPISRRGSVEDTHHKDSRDGTAKFKTPVALIKEGFSLTLSDSFACTVPISDAYAPIDHWQWMATLWRGTLGPDLVVYVKPSLEEEIAKCGTVDLHKGLMVIRIAVGKDLDEASERRVAFEVVEWPGQTVQLNDGRKGIVRFAGNTHFQVGEWIGVELDEKTGKNDGSVQGERYFDCPMGYGMFVKPMMATIVAQAPTPKPQARKPSRPSSFNPASGRASSAAGDAGLGRRKSLNAPSPSPVPRVARPTSIARVASPTKSPTKQMSAASSTPVSRTGTPSHPRAPSVGAKSRPSLGGGRTSMGPPPPTTRPTRQVSASSTTPRPGGPTQRSTSSRMSLTGPSRPPSRPSSAARRPSIDSQARRGSSDREDEISPIKDNGDILSPQPRSPVQARTKALEKLTGGPLSRTSTPPTARKPTPTTTTTRPAASTAASREIEDLKAKLKVLERKRVEDRDKLKQLEKVQGERDKFENVIQMLQQKYQPQQQENAELKKLLKEGIARIESMEEEQAEHESVLELATLDREMAEETAEVMKAELDALKQKAEEMELEVEILREENEEYSNGMTPEDRASTNWLQMERTNERLREALIRLRDLTQASEEELRDQISGLEDDLKEFNTMKEELTTCRDKLEKSESAIEDLRQQLDNALGAEDMIEDLTERNMSMSEQIEELKAVIDDLESLKEINDELEINHVQNEKEMQEELDFKDSVIAEQARRAGQQEESLEDMEYTLSRFRELVTSLQSDLDDMRASQAVTEGESEKLNDRSRAMMDLNMKLQISASKAQVKTIDLELRRLEAQEAEQHLEIVKLFLPDTYKEDQDSVLSLLRFRRVAFKANLLNSFIRERLNGQPHPGHEDDVFAGCDASDKLVWVSNMCDRFVNDMTHCTIEQFSKYQNALHELEPVERALNVWIDGLRRDDLKEKTCADELHRTIALLSHLGEVHISTTLANYADDIHMKTMIMQSHLDSAAVAFNTSRVLVQRVVPADGDDEELAQHFVKKSDAVVTNTRGAKVIAAKAVRALQELRTRSLSLLPDTNDAFDQCYEATQELANLARQIGLGLHNLFTTDESRVEPFTYAEVQSAVHKTVLTVSTSSESDLFSTYLSKLRDVTTQITDLASLATDLDQVQEFDVAPAPWRLRSQELKALKTIPVDAEEELRRLKEEHSEARRTIAQRDEHLSTAVLKIETLESRMRDAQANIDRITQLQIELEASGQQIGNLKEEIEKQDRELKNLESERDKWKKIASDSRAFADGADAAGAKAGQERAVATAREMDALKKDIESLQSAVRYLREDNRRARTSEQHKHEWLAEPLKKSVSVAEQRRNMITTEGKDVLGELVKMASSASLYDFSALPQDKLAWKPARSTPQYHAAKQAEDYATWGAWQESVLKRAHVLQSQTANAERRKRMPMAARLRIKLPGIDGKTVPGSGRDVQIVGSQEWEALQGRLAV